LVVSIRIAGVTVKEIVTGAFWSGLAESVTVAVKLNAPLLVGVPEIVPADERVRPEGSEPEVIDQV
jgi:hypothetical protein